MRINQFVASISGLSRRAADAAIVAGRVRVAGRTAVLGQDVSPEDLITLDDASLAPKTTHTYLMLHKPTGYISSRAKQSAAPTLYELIPEPFRTLRIAGRLDRDSSGLILLTDDGAFIQSTTHPSRGKTKQYQLTLTAPLTHEHLTLLKSGIMLPDGPSHVTILETKGKTVTLTIGEGRNRQLRRTFGALGLGVTRLHRTRVGSYQLADLPSGAWRHLEASEGSA